MCITAPMKIISLSGQSAVVKTRRQVERQILISLIEDAKVGDWVLVNGEMAVEKIDEKEARDLIRIINKSKVAQMQI